MRPFHILLFLLSVGVLGLGTTAVWPEDGVKLSDEFTLKFPTYSRLFEKDTTEVVNLDSLLASYKVDIDSTAIKDSLRLAQLAYRQKILRIQYRDDKKLENFFAALKKREEGSGKVRILHYGDSQIEGDRITGVVRNGLQKKFGGTGPGFVAACPLTSSIGINNKRSSNWKRHPVFGTKDSTLTHNHYGMYGAFSRFTGFPVMDTVFQDSIRTTITRDGLTKDTTFRPDPIIRKVLPSDSVQKAWVEYRPTSIGYYSARKYSRMKILFRNPDAPFRMTVILSDSTKMVREFPVNSAAQEYDQKFVKSPDVIRIEFEARSSPDIYAVRLENDYGVVMDNIPMRGSSGTYFGRINHSEMSTQFANTKPDLIILQFGGNTVPYMKEEARVIRYGKWFENQIKYLKRMNPDADFIVIGPSDMSTKLETRYVTYPLLPTIRDVLKTAALDQGAGYWDMYEVMGGRNSMPQWVAADPPLAAPDYVHFTRAGARKIAELFYDALIKDYEEYTAK